MVELTYSNWFSRIGKSIGGIIIGVVFFFGSFVLLYWNEGGADLSKIAKMAVDINATKDAGSDDGKLVCINGEVSANEEIGDDMMFIPSKYLLVNREAQVYAWTERKESETKKDAVGGGETTTTHYYYEKRWVSKAEDDSNFNQSEKIDYERKIGNKVDNTKAMERVVEDGSKKVETVIMGKYTMDTSSLTLPSAKDVDNLEGKVDLPRLRSNYRKEIKSKYVYIRKSSGESGDNVGDEKVSYSVVRYPFQGCVFGKLDGTSLKTYNVDIAMKNENTLFRLFDTDRESAIKIMHSEFVFWLWLCRIGGFLAMFIGLILIFDPISTVLDLVGMVGSVSRFLVNVILFFVSLALSIITIIVSAIAHNLIVLIIVLAVIVGLIIFFLVSQKKKGGVVPQ